jgi:hypothetical protein
MFLSATRPVKFLCVTVSVFLAACSGEDQATQQADLESAIDTQSEALYYTQDRVACATYEAETMSHTGGTANSDASAWSLRNAGENISATRSYATGLHTIDVIAWGTKGSDGVVPALKVSLNNYSIGTFNVTNTSITSGWSKYVVTYNVQTAGNKTLKIELANPGAGRKVLIDGAMVHCPGDGVICGSEHFASACCTASGSMVPGLCGQGNNAALLCDQNSDCASGDVCAFNGHPQNGFGVQCVSPSACHSVDGYLCGQLCKTPTKAETACPSGTTCTDFGVGDYMNAPGYKYCSKI